MTRGFVRNCLIGAALFACAATCAAAQTPPTGPAPRAAGPPAPTPPTVADEDFELDIVLRRITESEFHAATEITAGDAGPGGLDLRVGARVRAGDIDVLLRNVRGRVRFRASLAPVLRLLEARRGQRLAPAPQADTPPE